MLTCIKTSNTEHVWLSKEKSDILCFDIYVSKQTQNTGRLELYIGSKHIICQNCEECMLHTEYCQYCLRF